MTSSRRRPHVLPALSAALVGALTAGAATFMANTESVADSGRVDLAVENAGSTEQTHVEAGDPAGSVPTPPSPTPDPTTTRPAPSSPESPPTSADRPGTPTARPTPPQDTQPPQVSQEEQVVALVNAAREQSGCGPVRIVPQLVQAARGHSTDMSDRDYFDHTTPEGVGFAERILAAGYSEPGAENIARGQRSATQVMNSWMESDGHRANILNCQLTAIGVGLNKEGWYWTQNFGY